MDQRKSAVPSTPQNTSSSGSGAKDHLAPTTAASSPFPTAESTPFSKQQLNSEATPSSEQHPYCSLPEEFIRGLVSPLFTSECSNRTFRNILSSVDHLSVLPGVKEIVLSQVLDSSVDVCTALTADLVTLEQIIKEFFGPVNQVTDEASSSSDAMVTTSKSSLGDVNADNVVALTLRLFTPSSSNQAKLLRLMKTLDYMYSKKKQTQKPAETDAGKLPNAWRNLINGGSGTPSEMSEAEDLAGVASSSSQALNSEEKLAKQIEQSLQSAEEQALVAIWNKPNYEQLWKKVSDCLILAQNETKLDFIPSALLPVIECVMIVCKYNLATSQPSGDNSFQLMGSASPMHPLNVTDELFYSFTDKHRKILNQLVRKNPKLLRGPFALLVRNGKLLEFDNKRNFFNQQLHKKPPNFRAAVKYIKIRRQHIFQDSYYQLGNLPGDELKYGKLSIQFTGEEGADYGGVSREWYQELTKEMFNPNYALFTPSAEKMSVTYQPNPTSWVNPSHLLYFKFVGRVIGKAIYDSRLLDCYFTRSVYKHILGKSVDMSDMEAIDPEYHKSLVWIIENDITDILDLTFSMEIDEFGQQKVIDLKPDGRNIAVTEQNKNEYVKLVVEHRLYTTIKEQIQAFLSGFHDIVSKDLVKIFNEKELELLISGVPDIDVDDWKNNSEYRGYSASSPQIQWFWRAVRSFNQEERAKLLQFSTGTSKVPLEGFQKLQGSSGLQRFQIHKDFGSITRLPSAHTCFNQIDLPVYESYEQLRERLYIAITEAATGFGFE